MDTIFLKDDHRIRNFICQRNEFLALQRDILTSRSLRMVEPMMSSQMVAFKNVRKENHCDIPILSKDFQQFMREYFACARISNDLLNKVINLCEDFSQQQLLGGILQASSFRREGCQKRSSQRCALKYIISQLEARQCEVDWQLYYSLTQSMIENTTYVSRIYFDESFSRYLVLQERRCQLSHGTTGLSCWQGSCDLANYLMKFGRRHIVEKDVLELGAGCGLVGIALAASGFAKSVTLSDGNEHVLNIIRRNIRENFLEDWNHLIRIIHLEWETVNVKQLPIVPNVIVAADVIYDPSVITSLVSAVRKLLVASIKEGNSAPYCLTANTLRNHNTLNEFLVCVGEYGLIVKECFSYENGIFTFVDSAVKDELLFPFTSNIHCPTIFHKLMLKN